MGAHPSQESITEEIREDLRLIKQHGRVSQRFSEDDSSDNQRISAKHDDSINETWLWTRNPTSNWSQSSCRRSSLY
ncbi:unnamed protein product [Acanthoscelides obtectus]|uniref:Uncharacterized protein n=1 Tax=Acanthoscelides obtectus TaxID=200917 RepID=A0A9P0KVM8_ACAOB|nr:unnamed protein product [Acanthoscelides obtectus]CAK1664404.1 hypothetical protein AOBTE_LOCUS24244 [Acanthoscelides obtectus]